MHGTPRFTLSVMLLIGLLASAAGPAHAAGPGDQALRLGLSPSALTIGIKFGCKLVQGKLVCGKDGDNHDGGDGYKHKHKKKSKDQTTPGERACPPGYIVLDKPNKYGAYCEYVDQSKSAPAPAPTKEECMLNMTGTPPNCTCPYGSVLHGSQGCMKTCCWMQVSEVRMYTWCHADAATARSKSVSLAATNGDPVTNLTCELTRDFPNQPD